MKLNRVTVLLIFVAMLACQNHASQEAVAPTETPPHHTRSLLIFPIFERQKPFSILSKPPPDKDGDRPKQTGGFVSHVLQGGGIGIEIRPLAPFQGIIDQAKKILPGGHGTAGRPNQERPDHPGNYERPHPKPGNERPPRPKPGNEGPYEPEDGNPHHPQPGYERPHNQRPGYERPHPQRPGYQRPHEQRPGHERPHEPEPGHEGPGEPESGYDRPHHERPGYERPHQQRPGYQRPHQQRPGHERPNQQRPGYETPRPQRPGHQRPDHEKPLPDNEKPKTEIPENNDDHEPLTEDVPGWEDIGEEDYGDGVLQPRKRRPKRFVDSKIYHVPLKYVSNGRTHRVRRIRNGLVDVAMKDA